MDLPFSVLAIATDIMGSSLSRFWQRAWRVDLAGLAERPDFPVSNCAVGAWTVLAPEFHPVWDWYFLSVVHLRAVDNAPPAAIYLPGATHELILAAMIPENGADPRRPAGTILHPCNFCAQFIAESDEAAAARVERDVQDIVDGRLNPDSDGLAEWVARYGDNMVG